MNPTTLNTIGLILDIVGIILLFFFGLTKDISREGHIGMIWDENPDEKEIKKWKLYNTLSILGFVLVIIGFIFQILSNDPEIFYS